MSVIINGDTGISPVTASGTSASVDGMTVGRGGGEISTNVVVGLNAFTTNSSGQSNIAIGGAALQANTSGTSNIGLGGTYNADPSLYRNTTGSFNVAVGEGTLSNNTTNTGSTGIGYKSGNRSIADYNTFLGYNAGQFSTSGGYNVYLGAGAGPQAATSTGGSNIGIGVNSLNNLTTGSYNVVVGMQALYSNTTGNNNTAVGYQALYANTTSSLNVAVGTQCLITNSTGTENTAVGHRALRLNTNSSNSAFGTYALDANSSGYQNTAVGVGALQSNTVAGNSTAVGFQAGYTFNGSGGAFNTFIGNSAGYNVTTGTGNTFVGGNVTLGGGSGYYMTTGSKNTILGGYSGNAGGLDIRTASNYIVLSDGDGNPRLIVNGSGSVSIGRTSPVSNEIFTVAQDLNGNQVARIVASNASSPYGLSINYSGAAPNNTSNEFLYCYDPTLRMSVRSNGGIANYSGNNVNLSDQREKKDIELAGNYLDKICAIPVKTFNYIDQPENDTEKTLGVIAQDVQSVAPELVMESNWADKDQPEKMRLSIYQTDLQYALMKAIQELKAEVDSLKQQLGK